MSKRFPSFTITASLHPSGSYPCFPHKNKARLSITGSYASCSSPLFLSATPSLSLCHSFQTRCGFLQYIFGVINSWCFASQLLLGLTQTTTKW
ncbi:unnamed protein product [Hymenolepis diminuta]|uniref:Uncharacterized protein n=1 Tax=Hymenolepis diminuta TaxID=6216 RepID=A0A564YDX2_HYMDI|nr:unnamed protein product [Hymenolepis diminuta]